MQDEQPGFFGRIARFIAGDTKRTAKSASMMNQIVDGLNALLAMQGTNGIRVVPAAAGFTIELDDAVKESLGMLPILGAGGAVTKPLPPLRWRGTWDAALSYAVGDIVIVTYNESAGDATAGGTYVCIVDAPSGTTSPKETESGNTASSYWSTFAKGAWDDFIVKHVSGAEFRVFAENGSVDVALFAPNYGWSFNELSFSMLNSAKTFARLTMEVGEGAAPARIYLDGSGSLSTSTVAIDLVDCLVGKTVKFRVVTDPDDVTKHRLFLCSEAF